MSDDKVRVESVFTDLVVSLSEGADDVTRAMLKEANDYFEQHNYQAAGVQMAMAAARRGRLAEVLARVQDAFAVEVASAAARPEPAAFTLLETDKQGAVAFDCFLCKLENRESFHFKGMPPGYDFASKLPVCDEHADEPTSVRTNIPPAFAPDFRPCGRCKVEFNIHTPPPFFTEQGREYNVQAHTRPSDFICNDCTLALCRELIRRHE